MPSTDGTLSPYRAGDDDTAALVRRGPRTKGERHRRAILDGMTELLSTRPIVELTVVEIAAAAGLQRSGFYFYFESKYTALAAITSGIWSEFMDRANSVTRFDNEPVDEFFNRTAGAALMLWRDHQEVLIASVQAIPHDERLAAMWRGWNQHLAEVIAQQVIADRDRGLARPVSADVPALTSMLLEMTMHIFYMDRLRQCDEQETHSTMELLRSVWLASAWRSP